MNPSIPAAIYNQAVQTLTCPHCGQTYDLHEWALIEKGYARVWKLEEGEALDGSPYINAHDDNFTEEGDGAMVLAHFSQQCDRESALPEGFDFEWNGGV